MIVFLVNEGGFCSVTPVAIALMVSIANSGSVCVDRDSAVILA